VVTSRRVVRVRLVGVLCAAASAATLAQVPGRRPEGTSTFRSGVEIATIDVSVLDKQRRPVRGLTQADFTIVEDGKAQPIVGFRAVEIPGARAYSAAWMREVPPDVVTNRVDAERMVVVFMDDFAVGPDPFTRQAAQKIGHRIVDELGPLDMAGVIYAVNEGSGQEMTADRQALHRAIDRYISARPPSLGATPSAICFRSDCVMDAFKNVARILNGWPGKRRILAYVSPPEGWEIGSPNVEQAAFEANVNAYSNGWDVDKIVAAFQDESDSLIRA